MLIRREGPCINVNVRINFNGRDMQSTWFENCPDAAGNDPFPNPRDNTTSYQDVFHLLYCLEKKIGIKKM